MKLRSIIPAAGIAAAVLLLAACGPNTNANTVEHQQQQQDATTYEQVQPIPHFAYSVYREVGTDVEAIQALGEQTTSFFFNYGVRDPYFTCPSLGEPFPNTASLSNPLQVVHDSYPTGGAAVPVGQMDPNGVYTPTSSSGTYVLCINAQGQKYLKYAEGPVDAVSGPARWDYATHQEVVFGAPSMPKCTVTGKGSRRATTCVK